MGRRREMKVLQYCLMVIQIAASLQSDNLLRNTVMRIGKRRCPCSFAFVFDDQTCSLVGGCNERCDGAGTILEGDYFIELKVKKGNVIFSKCKKSGSKSHNVEARGAWGDIIKDIVWSWIEFGLNFLTYL